MQKEDTPREIMTLAELANYLKVAEKTVVRMAREGKIPGTKVASQWRFMRGMVDQWLENRMQRAHPDNMFELMKMAPEVVPVSRLVAPDLMLFDLKPGKVSEVLEQLVSPLQEKGMVDNTQKYLQLLIDRENLHSTAIAPGVAIPHARSPASSTLNQSALVVGICPEGTDFGADDHEKTHVFLLICSEDDMVHLRLLGKISKLLAKPKVIDRLSKCASSEQVIGLLAETEWKLALKHAEE